MDWFYNMEDKKRLLLAAVSWIPFFICICAAPEVFLVVPTLILSGAFTMLAAIAHDKEKKAEAEQKAAEEAEKEALRRLSLDDLGIHIQGLNFKRADPESNHDGTVTQERLYLSTPKSVTDFLASNSYVVVDLETSGLSKYNNEIIEIAMIKIQNGQEVGRFQSLVKPCDPITNKITQITGITNEMLETAPSFSEIADSVVSFIGDNVLIAHNSSFDIGFLSVALEPRALHLKHIDTLYMARTTRPDLPNHKLETLISHYGVADKQAHRAMGDVECTQKIFVRLCADIIAGTAVAK